MGERTVLAAVAMGSNVGERAEHLRAAVEGLERLPRTFLVVVSSFVRTEAVGWPGGVAPGGAYLNAAALLSTGLGASELLRQLLLIERWRGRDREAGGKWGPRTLDLDLLLYGDEVIDEPGLVVPHPRMHERLFVLKPLAQIAPNLLVPGRGRTVGELLASLESGAA